MLNSYRPYRYKCILVLASLLLAGRPSNACQICITFPENSPADHIIESELAVFAREDPQRPFHFSAIETLKGSLSDEPINLFLNSATRRHLSAHPNDAVLLVKGEATNDSDWRRIGLVDEDFRLVVKETLERAVYWEKAPNERTAYFATLLGNKNSQIHDLAHLELDRSPYTEIRKYGTILPRDDLRQFLGEMSYIEWHPLYILLLAQSDHSQDLQLIRQSMESASQFGSSLNLVAWATALVEIDQEEGVQFLENNYLIHSNRTSDERFAISEALSTHGNTEAGPLRDRIVIAYGSALERHSELTPAILKDLLKWERYDFSDQVAQIGQLQLQTFDPITAARIETYTNSSASQTSAN